MNALLAILKKLPGLLGSLFVLSLAVFWAAHLTPGDPLAAWYGERAERLTAEERAQTEEMLGLDAPCLSNLPGGSKTSYTGTWACPTSTGRT